MTVWEIYGSNGELLPLNGTKNLLHQYCQNNETYYDFIIYWKWTLKIPHNIAAPIYLFEGMIAYGVNNSNIFDAETAVQRLLTDLFKDDLGTCIEKPFEEIDADFKS